MEVVTQSCKVSLLGLGVVFIGLISLIIVVEIISKLVNNDNKNKTSNQSLDLVNNLKKNELNVNTRNFESQKENEELISVISAAIAAVFNCSTHNIIVKSIRRIPTNTPAWNRVSREEQISTRL